MTTSRVLQSLRNWTPDGETSTSFDELTPAPAKKAATMVKYNRPWGRPAQVDTYDEDNQFPVPVARQEIARKLATQRPAVAIKAPSATPAQLRYIEQLLGRLDSHNGSVAATAREWLAGRELTKERASDVIDRLKGHLAASAVVTESSASAPRGTGLAEILTDVPEARYALDFEDEPGKVRFYRVVTSQRGNKYLQIGHASGGFDISWNFLPVEKGALTVARRIAQNPRESMIRFGRELGVCGHCGRPLTDDASRAAGIGPICAKK